MRSRTLARCVVALLAVASLDAGARAPLGAQVTNPGFELPVITPGTFSLFNTGTTFNGWTVVGATGNVGVVSTTFTQSGFVFPAHGGAQWLDLTGLVSNRATGVEQAIATVAGTTYDLSFWVGNIATSPGGFGTTSTVNVFVDGVALAGATNSGGSGNTLFWQQFVRTFTATGALTTVRFINGDGLNDDSNGLDDIALAVSNGTPSLVPEPGAATLLATGLLALPALGWRRRRAARRST